MTLRFPHELITGIQVGAGIQVPPNCSKLLQRWGVVHELAGQAVRPDGISFRRWENGHRIGFTDLSQDFIDACGAPYYVVHRAHLHSALHKRAVDLGVPVRLNSRVTDYDTSVPSVKLADGQEFEADLVIAADGMLPLQSSYDIENRGRGRIRANVS